MFLDKRKAIKNKEIELDYVISLMNGAGYNKVTCHHEDKKRFAHFHDSKENEHVLEIYYSNEIKKLCVYNDVFLMTQINTDNFTKT